MTLLFTTDICPRSGGILVIQEPQHRNGKQNLHLLLRIILALQPVEVSLSTGPWVKVIEI
jgi:hypothetical protein